jgi:hypothetical protein
VIESYNPGSRASILEISIGPVSERIPEVDLVELDRHEPVDFPSANQAEGFDSEP